MTGLEEIATSYDEMIARIRRDVAMDLGICLAMLVLWAWVIYSPQYPSPRLFSFWFQIAATAFGICSTFAAIYWSIKRLMLVPGMRRARDEILVELAKIKDDGKPPPPNVQLVGPP